ncbi:MAG TPA: hypothetical protein VMY34_06805 [Acidimicrobiales bacterium]|nr:hypothetical protein [Acidimicrobiales bacterium]
MGQERLASGVFAGLCAVALVTGGFLVDPSPARPVVRATVEHDPAWQPRCPSPKGWQGDDGRVRTDPASSPDDALRALAARVGGDRAVMTSSPEGHVGVLAVILVGDTPQFAAFAFRPGGTGPMWSAATEWRCQPVPAPPAWVRTLGEPTCGQTHRSHVSAPVSGDRDAGVVECFAAAVDGHRSASMVIHSLTAEGDPTSEQVRFDGLSGIEVVYDSTSDHYGAPRWTLKRCFAVGPPPWFVPDGDHCADATPEPVAVSPASA